MNKKQEWYQNNKKRISEKQKKFRKDNADIMKKRNSSFYLRNKEDILKKAIDYREKNKENKKKYDIVYSKIKEKEIKEYQKEYRKNNKEKSNSYQKVYQKQRMLNDPLFKLTKNIRTLIGNSFKKKFYKKGTKTTIILGCAFEEFKIYLESKFEYWMRWENKGNWNGYPKEINTHWDIDHIIPLDSAKTLEEIIKLNHYTNLRPFCSYTNRVLKRNRS